MIFSKLSTETSPSKKPKHPKNNLETWYVYKKNLNIGGVLYIIKKVLKNAIQR